MITLQQCISCQYYKGGTCKAFPDSIPIDLLTSKVSHKKPYPGDNGIQFKQKINPDVEIPEFLK